MPKQSFSNHLSFYTPHHFVFYPLLLIAISASVNGYNHHPDQKLLWLMVIILFIFIGWSSFMMRQHYALGNQDRILRMELRFRYYIITGKRFEIMESQLTVKQMMALRFASDEELPVLVERAIKEKLTARLIKKSIIYWLPDMMRV